MKKRWIIVNSIISLLLLTGCIGPGYGDYSIELINGYDVVRVNPETIQIGLREDLGDGVYSWSTDIPAKVLSVGFDKRYIVALVDPTDVFAEDYDEDAPPKEHVYYIIDTESHEVSEPMSKSVYEKVTEVQHIELKKLDSYERNYEC